MAKPAEIITEFGERVSEHRSAGDHSGQSGKIIGRESNEQWLGRVSILSTRLSRQELSGILLQKPPQFTNGPELKDLVARKTNSALLLQSEHQVDLHQ
jgi:hypothetical protein